MNKTLLKQHVSTFASKYAKDKSEYDAKIQDRSEQVDFYKSYTAVKIKKMTEEDIHQYLTPLWALMIWGNKRYAIDKIITDNGLEKVKNNLVDLLWGKDSIEKRWDNFRTNVKGFGPAMISELLCKTHPFEYAIWNRRAFVGLQYLGVDDLPRYDYQFNGEAYKRICDIENLIGKEMTKAGLEDASLLAVDYFIWEELQVEDNLSKLGSKTKVAVPVEKLSDKESKSIHNDIRDKLRDIGVWLGFTSYTEQKVADGSVVDTVWEATIGNMGRVIYVFEVQTKGSIDSLIINLVKSLQNSAVQGVVAVSDREQIEKIKRHASGVPGLKEKLKFWDYEEILNVHQSLEFVNTSINNLGLVPQSF